ncbi:hypothetical protein HK098_003624 [Nowakowskiella sp. JEL0407]|nr:hypothetical protein HK098_003624 [Nowakowskiella sp. JEL0407]
MSIFNGWEAPGETKGTIEDTLNTTFHPDSANTLDQLIHTQMQRTESQKSTSTEPSRNYNDIPLQNFQLKELINAQHRALIKLSEQLEISQPGSVNRLAQWQKEWEFRYPLAWPVLNDLKNDVGKSSTNGNQLDAMLQNPPLGPIRANSFTSNSRPGEDIFGVDVNTTTTTLSGTQRPSASLLLPPLNSVNSLSQPSLPPITRKAPASAPAHPHNSYSQNSNNNVGSKRQQQLLMQSQQMQHQNGMEALKSDLLNAKSVKKVNSEERFSEKQQWVRARSKTSDEFDLRRPSTAPSSSFNTQRELSNYVPSLSTLPQSVTSSLAMQSHTSDSVSDSFPSPQNHPSYLQPHQPLQPSQYNRPFRSKSASHAHPSSPQINFDSVPFETPTQSPHRSNSASKAESPIVFDSDLPIPAKSLPIPPITPEIPQETPPSPESIIDKEITEDEEPTNPRETETPDPIPIPQPALIPTSQPSLSPLKAAFSLLTGRRLSTKSMSDMSTKSPNVTSENVMYENDVERVLSSANLAPTINVSVTGFNLKVSEKGKEMILFSIKCQQEERTWIVEKKYNDFVALDSKLKSTTKAKLPKIPEKSLILSHQQSKFEQKKIALEMYLQSLILALGSNPELIDFLNLNAIEVKAIPEKESPELRSNVKIDNAPPENKTGVLAKRGKNFGGWKIRYVVLNNGILDYYENKSREHCGSIKLKYCTVSPTPQSPPDTRPQITITEYKKSVFSETQSQSAVNVEEQLVEQKVSTKHVFSVENEHEQTEWVAAISEHIRFVRPSYEIGIIFPSIPISTPEPPADEVLLPSAQVGSNLKLPKRRHQLSNSVDESSALTPSTQIPVIPYVPMVPQRAADANPPPETQAEEPEQPLQPNQTASNEQFMAAVPIPGKQIMTMQQLQPTPKSKRNLVTDENDRIMKQNATWVTSATVKQADKKVKKGFSWGKKKGDGASAPNNIIGGKKSRIFGVPLELAVLLSRIPGSPPLPAVVYRCIEYLEMKGCAEEEGIYRLSGASSNIHALRDKFDNEYDVNLLESGEFYDIHVISGLLKLYLRDLPTPVLTRELQKEFLHVQDLGDRSEKIKKLTKLMSILPIPNYVLLQTVIGHIIRIVQNSEKNKMTLRNVGIVFSPTLSVPAGVFTLMMADYSTVFSREFEDNSGETSGVRSNSVNEDHGNSSGREESQFSESPSPPPPYNDNASEDVGNNAQRDQQEEEIMRTPLSFYENPSSYFSGNNASHTNLMRTGSNRSHSNVSGSDSPQFSNSLGPIASTNSSSTNLSRADVNRSNSNMANYDSHQVGQQLSVPDNNGSQSQSRLRAGTRPMSSARRQHRHHAGMSSVGNEMEESLAAMMKDGEGGMSGWDLMRDTSKELSVPNEYQEVSEADLKKRRRRMVQSVASKNFEGSMGKVNESKRGESEDEDGGLWT